MKLRILYLLPLLLLQCKKKDDPAAEYRLDASGITPVDANGVSMGAADPTDWTFDATWDAQTTALFPRPDAASLAGAVSPAITPRPAAPNPNSGYFQWFFTASGPTYGQIVITDERLKEVSRHSITVTAPNSVNGLAFQLPADVPAGNYRLHYAFYNEQGMMYYKGHGDIRVQR